MTRESGPGKSLSLGVTNVFRILESEFLSKGEIQVKRCFKRQQDVVEGVVEGKNLVPRSIHVIAL
jgi:hypothetical protein